MRTRTSTRRRSRADRSAPSASSVSAPVFPIEPSPLARPVERVPVTVYADSAGASRAAAAEIAALIRERAAQGRRAVLGLATGSTPQGVYEALVRLHRDEGLSFKNVVTFNLDEYWPMRPDELQSYRRFMREHLFDLVDIPPGSTHVPDGTVPHAGVPSFCEAYERAIAEAGGIDLQILGIGRTGHIGFNEPGSPRDSRTRLITLDRVTRLDAASDFFGERHVPSKAITMGVGTILRARRILLLAFGEHKAGPIRRAVEGEVSSAVAASFLQEHPSAQILLDPASAAELTRFKTPWKLGPVEAFGLSWDAALTRKAVIWLALQTGKPITQLTTEDYNEHHLQDLLATRPGGAYDINIEVFKRLRDTITGWPGGKPGHQPAPGRSAAFPKRVIVFSPHPDDDVISMGGTFIRLCDQGHEVHVAYQTSGNIAVFDDTAVRHADFVAEFCRAFGLFSARDAARIERHVQRFVRRKCPGEVDSPELQKIKALIRRTEARAGARYSGVKPEHTHFLDMPFYETGRVKKKPLGEADIRVITDLLERVRPHQIYAAGDLSDPHGTHRVCLSAIITAIRRLLAKPATRAWMRACEVWLYRGAWQEWGPEDLEMAVPLSPDEVERKRMAIFKHESQKDRALFPGPDSREFWQRAEDRNRHTAMLYDKLGLPQYQAMEGFVRWRPGGAGGLIEAKPRAAVRRVVATTRARRAPPASRRA
ncbi:MAG: glucosamine-6-phosphate deaminase [Phycisphaerae bacterium]|nr:glucosamine-6-phosphate deaminase [Phycisphaerae bacterium]